MDGVEEKVNEILSCDFSTPDRLARAYQGTLKNAKFSAFPISQASQLRIVAELFERARRKEGIVRTDDYQDALRGIQIERESHARGVITRLSESAQKLLRQNCSLGGGLLIAEILADFEGLLLRLPDAEQAVADLCRTGKHHKALQKREAHAKALLNDGFSLDEKIREALKKIAQGPILRETTMDPVKAIMLENNLMPPKNWVSRPVKECQEWSMRALAAYVNILPRKSPGRPADIIFTALQGVLYSKVSEEAGNLSNTEKRQLTAKIINDYFKGKGFKTATPKTVEHAADRLS